MRHSVVFDTSILLAGTAWKGSAFHCLRMAWAGKVRAVTCRPILTEFETVLREKRFVPAEDAARVVAEVRGFSRLVAIAHVLKTIGNDPADDKVLECAVVGGANYIVTCDRRHLLPLSRYHGIAIVTATDFLTIMSTW